jgi:hypothetical protein
MNDVWSEYVAEDGVSAMRRETLMIPEGKKPLIVSYDDVNYYDYMIENGFTHKLIIGGDGEIWSYGLDPAGSEVVTKELDAITILNEFVRERPDFSLNGVKGCLCLTGYQGVLGYRTQEGVDEALRSREIKEAKRVIAKLKADGWYFASHSWGHINFERSPLEKVIADANRWRDQVEPLVGKTKLMVYPFGSRLDGADETQTGEAFKYYHALGFRVFASVGRESYSYIKSDISAVVCDRMHSDGGTLRAERERYMKFYDAAEVWDDARPELGMRGAKDW